MNIIFIVLAIILCFFIITFIIGAVLASKNGSDKVRRANALISLSKMTEDQRNILIQVYKAYKNGNTASANFALDQASQDNLNFLINYFDINNRPSIYSSGFSGNKMWLEFVDRLKKAGYSEKVAKVLPVVILDNYNEVLDKMSSSIRQNEPQCISILGESIDPDNMPILYRKVVENPETLERQLKSIANAWHEGNIRAAMLALESDLEHNQGIMDNNIDNDMDTDIDNDTDNDIGNTIHISTAFDIVSLVISSKRTKPAFLYPEAFHNDTCRIDYEPLTEKDYQEIIANAYHMSYLISGVETDTTEEDMSTLIKIGEDLAIAAYIGIKSGRLDLIKDLERLTVEANVMKLNIGHDTRLYNLATASGNVHFYFGFCQYTGQQIANGTPENIPKLLSGVYKIEKPKGTAS